MLIMLPKYAFYDSGTLYLIIEHFFYPNDVELISLSSQSLEKIRLDKFLDRLARISQLKIIESYPALFHGDLEARQGILTRKVLDITRFDVEACSVPRTAHSALAQRSRR